MQVTLKLVEYTEKSILQHLWDLYSYDFSIYNNEDVLPQGSYDFYYGDDYFSNLERSCYFILVDGKIGGFISINNSNYFLNIPDCKSIVDFFVMNKYRKGGVGRKAAYQIFDLHKGFWEVAQYDNNNVSKLFWQKVISDYTDNHYETRTVVQRDYTLQAIIFDSNNKSILSLSHELRKMDDLYHIHIYSRPNEDIINQLILIAQQVYPTYDEIYKNLRRDLKYQDVIAIGTDDEIFGFIMFTSIDGNAEITFNAIKPEYRYKGYTLAMMRSFIQHMYLSGFDKITVDFDTKETLTKFNALYNFYIAFGFYSFPQREEFLEYIINNQMLLK